MVEISMNDRKPDFYRFLTTACDEKGKTPNWVVNKLGLSSSTVNNWKRGHIPSGDILYRIACCLGVSIDSLLGHEIPISPQPPIQDPKLLSELNLKQATIESQQKTIEMLTAMLSDERSFQKRKSIGASVGASDCYDNKTQLVGV